MRILENKYIIRVDFVKTPQASCFAEFFYLHLRVRFSQTVSKERGNINYLRTSCRVAGLQCTQRCCCVSIVFLSSILLLRCCAQAIGLAFVYLCYFVRFWYIFISSATHSVSVLSLPQKP